MDLSDPGDGLHLERVQTILYEGVWVSGVTPAAIRSLRPGDTYLGLLVPEHDLGLADALASVGMTRQAQ